VTFGEDADGLLDAHSRRQGVFELRDGDGEPLRLAGLVRLVRDASAAGGGDPLRPRDVRLVIGRQVGGEQVGEHHGTCQVGDTLVADNPAPLRFPYDNVLLGRIV